MRRQLILAIAAAVVACAPKPQTAPPVSPPASQPVATPAAALVDHTGDSPETAVMVPADAPNEGIDFQNNWIYDRYGRFRKSSGGIAHAGEGAALRRYEVVTVELPDHSERTVYFDITENEKTWQTSRPKPH
jgi:hypothetical protein